MNAWKVLSLICAIICTCESYKILALFPNPGRSHYRINYSIVKELVNRGHEVTHVTTYPQKSTPKNLREISVESLIDVISAYKENFFNLEKQTVFYQVQFLTRMGYIITEAALKHENIQKLLQTQEKYDVILMPQHLNEALLGITHHLKAPTVLLSTMPLFPWASFLLKHPSPPSYLPHLLLPYTGHMNFWERFINSFHVFYSILYHQWVMLPKHRELVRKYIPNQPDLYNFVDNASLLLMNSHMSTYEAMPQVPNAVEIGGAHIEEPKPLPTDLQEFLDNSKDGAIVFSLGSNLQSSTLPQDSLNQILTVFSKLKQNVLFKWETDVILPNHPRNVKLMKWLPLNDVLAHPNVKTFVTHGGLLSLMESVYHAVPVVGIPFFVDQKMNMAIATSDGYAVTVPFQELNENSLSEALDKVLTDPKYRENAKFRSQIMKDRPLKPTDTAIYWIEYVIRHKGAPHLRYPGMDLAWYQRYLLDVVAFSFVVMIFAVYVIRMVLRRVFRSESKISQKKKKKKNLKIYTIIYCVFVPASQDICLFNLILNYFHSLVVKV